MNNKKNILIVTGLYTTPGSASYSGIFIKDQIKALSNYYNIFVVVPYFISLKKELKKPIKNYQKINGIHIHYIKYFSIILLILSITKSLNIKYKNRIIKNKISKNILKESKKLHKKFNFKLVHGHEVLIGDEASKIGKELQIPSFLTIHSLYDYHIKMYDDTTIKKILYNVDQTTHLITVSNLVIKSYKNKINKLFNIIPNGYTKKNINSLPIEISRIIKNKIVFLFAGFLINLKKPILLINSAISLKKNGYRNFVILVIGSGPQEKELKKIIKKENLTKIVLLLGDIFPKEMPSYFNCADIVVQPSISESFSMVCLEGMAFGKPIICTTNTGISEYITNSIEGFIISPNSQKELTEKIQLFIDQPKLINKMSESALKKSREFDLESITKKLIELYKNGRTK
ncbi:MAG: glycosyltransferase family 4 protein [Candidatus Kerfeldbacteria bacterium]